MSEIAGESRYQVWNCGRCRKAYKAMPAMELGCRCETPVAVMRPSYLTICHPAPTRRLHPAGPEDRLRAQFARRGKKVAVTVTGTVTDAWTVNGSSLTLIIETEDGRRIAVRPYAGDVLAETEEAGR